MHYESNSMIGQPNIQGTKFATLLLDVEIFCNFFHWVSFDKIKGRTTNDEIMASDCFSLQMYQMDRLLRFENKVSSSANMARKV